MNSAIMCTHDNGIDGCTESSQATPQSGTDQENQSLVGRLDYWYAAWSVCFGSVFTGSGCTYRFLYLLCNISCNLCISHSGSSYNRHAFARFHGFLRLKFWSAKKGQRLLNLTTPNKTGAVVRSDSDSKNDGRPRVVPYVSEFEPAASANHRR